MTIDERIEILTVNIESLHSSASELHATAQSHERQIEALTSQSSAIMTQTQQDAENIRGLVRIAEIHERRLSHIEGQDQA